MVSEPSAPEEPSSLEVPAPQASLEPSRPPAENEAREHWLHPLTWLFQIASALRASVWPLIGLGIFGSSSGFGLFWLMPMFVLLVLSSVPPVLRFLNFRYWLRADHLQVREGVLSRQERRIPYSRINNLDVVQNLFHRLFGMVVVSLETASGGKPEAVLHLTPESLAELRQAVQRRRSRGTDTREQRTGAGQPAAVEEETEQRLIHEVPTAELVRLGLIQNRGLVIVAALLGVVYQVRGDFWEAFPRWVEDAVTRFGDFQVAAPLAAVLGFTVFFAIAVAAFVLLSVLFAVTRYYGFRLSREGSDLRAQFGLFTSVARVLPRFRIQRFWARQTLLHRFFDRLSIGVDTAGGGPGSWESNERGGQRRQWLAPIAEPEQLPDLFHEALTEVSSQPVLHPPKDPDSPWRPIASRAWKRLLRRRAMLVCLPLVAAAFYNPWVLLLLLPLSPLLVFTARRSIACRHFCLTDEAIFYRSGWLVRTLVVVRFSKIQAVQRAQSPFDRRQNMARLRIDTAGSSTGEYAVDIPYLNTEVADHLTEVLYREASRSSFRWA